LEGLKIFGFQQMLAMMIPDSQVVTVYKTAEHLADKIRPRSGQQSGGVVHILLVIAIIVVLQGRKRI